MNLRCLIDGHQYESIRKDWQFDFDDMFHATNDCPLAPVRYYEYEIFRCKRCLKEKLVYTGKYENR